MKYTLVFFFFTVLGVTAFSQDLIITEVTGAMVFDRYEEISGEISIKNDGIVNISSPVSTSISLSKDNVFSSDDVYIGSISLNEIRANESQTVSFKSFINFDIDPGVYYLVAKADYYNSVNETNEANNTIAIGGYIIESPDVDLVFESFAVSSSVHANDVVARNYQIKNVGSTRVNVFCVVDFYISTDGVLDNDDIKINAYEVGSFSDSSVISSNTSQLIIPNVTPGEYYIIAQVRGFEETNLTNNVAVSQTTITASDIDLDISQHEIDITGSWDGDPYRKTASFYIKNDGTTGVSGYKYDFYLSDDRALSGDDHKIYDFGGGFGISQHLNGGDETSLSVDIHFPYPITGEYYLIAFVNSEFEIPETNHTNNVAISDSQIWLYHPPASDVVISNASFGDSYDDSDTDLNIKVTFLQQTSGHHAENYQVTIKEEASTAVTIGPIYESFHLFNGQTKTSTWNLSLSAPLNEGSYVVEIRNGYNDSIEYTLPLIIKKVYSFSGIIQGEDGTAITKGNLFLYRRENGAVKFTQRTAVVGSNEFSFSADDNECTLYFIPDKNSFPNYAPTIFGKTVLLGPASFLTLTEDTTVVFEILKVQPLPEGKKIIEGTISTSITTGRSAGSVGMGGIPVILLSESGTVVALTETNGDGYYVFINLPDGKYQIVAAFQLDQVTMKEPLIADLTQFNAVVNLYVSSEGLTSEVRASTENRLAALIVSPNPSKGFLKLSQKVDRERVALTDIQGRVLPINFQDNEIDISTLERGAYLLNVKDKGAARVFKIVKE